LQPYISNLRTDESFRDQDDKDHHKSISPLVVLPTKFVSEFPLDPFHLVFHGVLKRFLEFLLGKKVAHAKLKAREISQVSDFYESLTPYIPKEFQRMKQEALVRFINGKVPNLDSFCCTWVSLLRLMFFLERKKHFGAVHKPRGPSGGGGVTQNIT